jgi:hypothetical protein
VEGPPKHHHGMQEEIKGLTLENFDKAERLELAEASREAFHSRLLSLKEVNAAQRDDI